MRKKTIFTIAATSAAILIGTTVGTTLSSSLVSTKNNFSTVNNLQSKTVVGKYSIITVNGVSSYMYTTTPEDLEIDASGVLSGYSAAFKQKIEAETISPNLYINLEIPSNVIGITKSAFEEGNILNPTSNYKLISVDMRKATKLDEIKASAFAFNKDLRSVLFNENITTIGEGAFSELTAMKKPLDLSGTKVTTIGANAFKNSNFSYYFLPDTVTTIGNDVFLRDTNRVTSRHVNLPANLINKATFDKIGLWTPYPDHPDFFTNVWPETLFQPQMKWNLKANFDQQAIINAFINPTIGKTREQVISEFTKTTGKLKGELVDQIFNLTDDVNAPVDIIKALRKFEVVSNPDKSITINIEVSNLYKADKLTFTVLDPNAPVVPDTPTPTPPTPENPDNNGGGETTPPTPENPDNNGGGETTPPTPGPDNNGGGETTPPTPENPDNNGGGETTPPTPENPDNNGGGETTPPEPEPTPDINPVENKNSIIIGSAVGGIVFVILLIVVISLLVRRKK